MSYQKVKRRVRDAGGGKHEFVWDGRGERGEDARYSIMAGRAASDRLLKCVHFRILAHLGRFNQRKGWCRLNQSELAALFGVHRQAINKAINQLVKWRYIEKRDQADSGESFCLYRAMIDAVESLKDKGGSVCSRRHPLRAGVSGIADTSVGQSGHPCTPGADTPPRSGITTRAKSDHVDHIERERPTSLCKTPLPDDVPNDQMVAWVHLHFQPVKKGASLADIITRSSRRFRERMGETARTQQGWQNAWEDWWEEERLTCRRTQVAPAPWGIRREILMRALTMYLRGIPFDPNLCHPPANPAEAIAWLADLERSEAEFVTEFRSSPPPSPPASTTELRATMPCA